jgi:hypothetical protein
MSDEQLKYLVKERQAILEEQALIKSALDEVNEKILDLMGEESKAEIDGNRVTIVRQGNKVDYDWETIRSTIGDQAWGSITVEVPSKDLLERAIADGRIKLSEVATVEKPGAKPYVKVSEVK